MNTAVRELLDGFTQRAGVQRKLTKNIEESRRLNADLDAANELIRAAKTNVRTALGLGSYRIGKGRILIVTPTDVTIDEPKGMPK